eukprot:Tbor_TRINITY_DN6145_c0_g2::TRINITY_DN6145_c0_g2_i8::g.21733::m.21733
MRSQSIRSGTPTSVPSRSQTTSPSCSRRNSRARSLAIEYGDDQLYMSAVYGSEVTDIDDEQRQPFGATNYMNNPPKTEIHLMQYVQNRNAETRRNLPTENFFTGQRMVMELKGVDARCCATVGDTVWVGEKSGALSVWDIATGDLVERKEREERMFVTSIMSVGLYVWVGYSNGLLRVIDPETLQILKEVKEHLGAINQFLVAFNGASVYSCSADFTINQWCTTNVERIATLSGHTNNVRCMVLAGGVRLFSASDDKTIIEWDASMAKLRHVIKGDHKTPIRCMVATNSHLWSGAEDGSVRIYALSGHQPRIPTVIQNNGSQGDASSFCTGQFSSARQSMVISPSCPPIMKRNINTGSLSGNVHSRNEIGGEQNKITFTSQYTTPPHCVHVITNPHTSTVSHLRIVGSKVWSTSMGTVFIWDSESFQLETQFKDHSGFLTYVHVVHQSNVARVWTCGSEGTIKILNFESHLERTLKDAKDIHNMEVLVANALQCEEKNIKTEKQERRTTEDMRALMQANKKLNEQVNELNSLLKSRDETIKKMERLLGDERKRTRTKLDSKERLGALNNSSVEKAKESYDNKRELEATISDLEDKASEFESLANRLKFELEEMKEQNAELEDELEELRKVRDKLLQQTKNDEESLKKARKRENSLIGSLQQKTEDGNAFQRILKGGEESLSPKEGTDDDKYGKNGKGNKKPTESNIDPNYIIQLRQEIEGLEDKNSKLKEELREKDQKAEITAEKLKENRREIIELKLNNEDLKKQQESFSLDRRRSKEQREKESPTGMHSSRRRSDAQNNSASHQDPKRENEEKGAPNRYNDRYDSIINQYKVKQAELEDQLKEALAAAADATSLYEITAKRVEVLEELLRQKEDDRWYEEGRKNEVQRLNDIVVQLEEDINNAKGNNNGMQYGNDRSNKGGPASAIEDQSRIINRWINLEKQLTDPIAIRNYEAMMEQQRKEFNVTTTAALAESGAAPLKDAHQRVMAPFDDTLRYHHEREKKWRDLARAQRQLQNANGRIIVESTELASKLRNLSYLYETRPILVRSLYELYKLNAKMINTNEGFRKIVAVRRLTREELLEQHRDLHEEFDVSKEGIRWIIANLFTDFELQHIGASPSLFIPDGRRPTWRDITIPDRYIRLKEFQKAEAAAGYGTYYRSTSPIRTMC